MTRFSANAGRLAALLSVWLVPVSCADKKGTGNGDNVNKARVFVFVDRSDADWEHTYIVGEKGIFAQISLFPGYTNRRFFFQPHPAEKLTTEARQWEQLPGEIKPPFAPDGPWFSRTAVFLDTEEATDTDYFRDSNTGIRKWLTELRNAIVKDEYRVAEPPRWVVEDKRIKSRLGM